MTYSVRSASSSIPYASSSSHHQERPAHQTEPAALEGDKVAVVIQNFQICTEFMLTTEVSAANESSIYA